MNELHKPIGIKRNYNGFNIFVNSKLHLRPCVALCEKMEEKK